MPNAPLPDLKIDPSQRRRPRLPSALLIGSVAAVLAACVWLAWPRAQDGDRIIGKLPPPPAEAPPPVAAAPTAAPQPPAAQAASSTALVASGYIVTRERIDLSTRVQGILQWVGVEKGDRVSRGQEVARLDNAEYLLQISAAEARLARLETERAWAERELRRQEDLCRSGTGRERERELAAQVLDLARASIREQEAQLALLKLYLDWTVVRSPIDGVVLEKLAKAGELVTPQNFGGTRGARSSLLAVADPSDLQVEIDLNEADLSKVRLGQSVRVTPEAYPDRVYSGTVREIAPEANRQKGTLQVKVQIERPDAYLTPELSAKAEFLPPQTPPPPSGR